MHTQLQHRWQLNTFFSANAYSLPLHVRPATTCKSHEFSANLKFIIQYFTERKTKRIKIFSLSPSDVIGVNNGLLLNN